MEAERQAEQQAVQPTQQEAQPNAAQQATTLAAYQQAFPWTQAPAFVDLTNEEGEDDD